MTAKTFRMRLLGGLAAVTVLVFALALAGANDTAIVAVGTVASALLTGALVFFGLREPTL